MKPIIDYIPDLEQEEESLITAKIDSAMERLRKKMDEQVLSYIDKDKNINFKIQIETSTKS